jgi:hypothetical protein
MSAYHWQVLTSNELDPAICGSDMAVDMGVSVFRIVGQCGTWREDETIWLRPLSKCRCCSLSKMHGVGAAVYQITRPQETIHMCEWIRRVRRVCKCLLKVNWWLEYHMISYEYHGKSFDNVHLSGVWMWFLDDFGCVWRLIPACCSMGLTCPDVVYKETLQTLIGDVSCIVKLSVVPIKRHVERHVERHIAIIDLYQSHKHHQTHKAWRIILCGACRLLHSFLCFFILASSFDQRDGWTNSA